MYWNYVVNSCCDKKVWSNDRYKISIVEKFASKLYEFYVDICFSK